VSADKRSLSQVYIWTLVLKRNREITIQALGQFDVKAMPAQLLLSGTIHHDAK
jgi:hypothetical protein